MPRLAALATAASAAALLAGCGNEPTKSSTFLTGVAADYKRIEVRAAGVTLDLPSNFSRVFGRSPEYFRASVRRDYLAVFAYRRREPLPAGAAELSAARRRLVAAAKRRVRSYRLRSSAVTRIAGAPAIELVGDQRFSGATLRIRSMHVYKGDTEVVIEVAAPKVEFAAVDSRVSPRLKRTLKVTGKITPIKR